MRDTLDGKYEIVKGKCVVCGEETDCIDLGHSLMCLKDATLLNDISKVASKQAKMAKAIRELAAQLRRRSGE